VQNRFFKHYPPLTVAVENDRLLDDTPYPFAKRIDGVVRIYDNFLQTAVPVIHLHDTDHAEKEENHPDYLVSLEYVAYGFIVHFFSIYFESEGVKVRDAWFLNSSFFYSPMALANALNCSPLSSMFLNRSKLAQHGLSNTV
jgi:hypothetical protein